MSKTHSDLLADLRKGRCIVEKEITSTEGGRVKVLGSWWPAVSESSLPIMVGATVEVLGFENIALMVKLKA